MASELEELRSMVRNRHRAATQKVSRLNRSKGVKIAGTKDDVRRNPANIKGYNKKQLESYLGQLNTFVSRGTTFAPDYKGRALPGDKWKTYTSLERQFNNKRVETFDKIKHLFLPSSNMTIRERMAATTPDHPTAGNPSTRNPDIKLNRTSKGVRTEKGLNRLIKDMENRVSKQFEQRELRSAKKQLRQIMEIVGDKQLMKDIKALDDDQFRTLWFYTNFVTAMSSLYETIGDTDERKEKRKALYKSTNEDSLGTARDLVAEASKYDFASAAKALEKEKAEKKKNASKSHSRR